MNAEHPNRGMRLSRRDWFTATIVLGSAAALPGCRKASPRIPGATLERQAAQAQTRKAFLQALEPFRRPPGTTFRTAPPPVAVTQLIPELKGLVKLAHRLHPFATTGDLPPEGSHLGGPFLWPSSEPWPTVPETTQPLAPILQLRLEDAPPQVTFPPGKDLLQLFWSPYFADQAPRTELYPRVVWRKRDEVSGTLAESPFVELAQGNTTDLPESVAGAWVDYLPVPCALALERVLELPTWEILPERMKQTVRERIPEAETDYPARLSVAPGCKVGGYPPYEPEAKPPACPTCRWGMDYLLSVTEREWDHPRWQPTDRPAGPTEESPTGLHLGPQAAVHVFVCRRCEAWPVGVLV